MLRIKLVRSPIGHNPRNRATVQALGLRKIGQIVEKEDSLVFRGMIHKVKHLIIAWAPESETPLYDATQIRKYATRKKKTPPVAHHKH